ncbi:sugar phosphate nucleotidyltransferase [Clostridium sp. JNZ J1-5]
MKGVILAGGKGTRLYPWTKKVNKHLLFLGNEPMIFNPIKQLISSGIQDILIVTNRNHLDSMVEILTNENNFSCNFTFKIQENPKGIGDALLLAEDFAKGNPITVILGDNITSHSIKKYVQNFKLQGTGSKILIKRVPDPYRFGVATLRNNRIVKIEEKPSNPKSNYAVTGIYMYDNQLFDILKSLSPSFRGELEITSVNNFYLNRNQLTYDILHGEWADAGTFSSYAFANKLLSSINNKILDGDKL